MSRAERALRDHLAQESAALEMLHTLLAEHRAVVEELNRVFSENMARARTEALEEAATMLERIGEARGAIRTRALITTPTPAAIPVEKARKAIADARRAVALRSTVPPPKEVLDEVARHLGVTLDAEVEVPCIVCDETGPHKMSCRPTARAAAVAHRDHERRKP